MLREGSILGGRYRLLEFIAQGGMALIYRAYDLRNDALVAVKIMRPDRTGRPEVAERLRHEAHVLARLNHPGVVPYVDFQVEGDLAYLVMAWIEGETLRSLLDRQIRPFPLSEITPWVKGLCDVLAYLHGQGVVHRDIKSRNILIARNRQPVLIDFSIALDASTAEHDPLAQVPAGTSAYMAPEQMAGKAVDARADIYALGTVLFEVLTLARPFADVERAASPEDRWQRLREAKTTRDPPSVARYREGLPDAIVTAVDRALAREPAARWSTAQELWAAWSRSEPPIIIPASDVRRKRLGLVVAGALTMAALAVMLLLGGGINDNSGASVSGFRSFNVCHRHDLGQGAIWATCLESVAFSPQNLTVTLRWQAILPDPGMSVTKYSDVGNRNLYLLDDKGRRYDCIAVAGDAGRDLEVVSGQILRGQYIFPAIGAERGPFTFVDDDVGAKLRFDLK